MKQKVKEQRSLIIGIFFNLLMGLAGLIVYQETKIEAMFVDAYFTIVAVGSGIFAVFISKLSAKRSRRFPNGFFILEPFYALLKSILTLGLLVFSTITVSRTAYQYFIYGEGQILQLKPIIPYAFFMVILCFILSFYYDKQNKAMNSTSTILLAETKGAMIDGILSAGIGIGATLVFFIDSNSAFSFLLYTGDFFITWLLVLFSVKTPLIIIRDSLSEITGVVLTNSAVLNDIEKCVYSHLDNKRMIKGCLIYKIGMSFKIRVELSEQVQSIDTAYLIKKKEQILNELRKKIEFINLEFTLFN